VNNAMRQGFFIEFLFSLNLELQPVRT
jgi:hypothetical protein